jgi:hypothetical protein
MYFYKIVINIINSIITYTWFEKYISNAAKLNITYSIEFIYKLLLYSRINKNSLNPNTFFYKIPIIGNKYLYQNNSKFILIRILISKYLKIC